MENALLCSYLHKLNRKVLGLNSADELHLLRIKADLNKKTDYKNITYVFREDVMKPVIL